MPFGLHGVIAGTSRCFFAFSGFEIISTTGEEAKNPKRTIPLAIALTLLVVTSVYFGISSVTTLIWPYYLQVSASFWVTDDVGVFCIPILINVLINSERRCSVSVCFRTIGHARCKVDCDDWRHFCHEHVLNWFYFFPTENFVLHGKRWCSLQTIGRCQSQD